MMAIPLTKNLKTLFFVLHLLHIWLFTQYCKTEMTNIHTSIYSLEKLLKAELEFKQFLDKYVSEQNHTENFVTHFIKEHYKYYDPGIDHMEYVSNPLNAFGLVKRTSFDLKNLYQDIQNPKKIKTKAELKLYNNVKNLINNFTTKFPSSADFHETCISLALIQETYDLNIQDLRKGVIRMKDNLGGPRTFEGKSSLNCDALYQVGVRAATLGWYDSAYLWLKQALDNCKNEKIFRDIKKSYQKNMEVHDDILETREQLGNRYIFPRTFMIPIDKKLHNRYRYKDIVKSLDSKEEFDTFALKKRHFLPLFQYNATKWGISERFMARDNFHELCKEGSLNRIHGLPTINKHLKCRFLNHNNAYLKLGPFLIEEVNFHPAVVLFRNFLSLKEKSYAKRAGNSGMKRSMTGVTKMDKPQKDARKGQASIMRTSKQVGISEKSYRFQVTQTYLGWDTQGLFLTHDGITNKTCPNYPPNVQANLIIDDPLMYKLTKRIELATNLVLDRPYASEPYQVVNYGIGGQYDIHPDVNGYHPYPNQTNSIIDSHKLWYSLVGDREATFMAYLSTVESGGGTAFPLLGVRTNPIVGDAVFWNNMFSDGKADYLSVHGGCPLVLGSKWVTNKWIMYYDNFRTTPCNLKEFQRLNTLSLWKNKNQ